MDIDETSNDTKASHFDDTKASPFDDTKAKPSAIRVASRSNKAARVAISPTRFDPSDVSQFSSPFVATSSGLGDSDCEILSERHSASVEFSIGSSVAKVTRTTKRLIPIIDCTGVAGDSSLDCKVKTETTQQVVYCHLTGTHTRHQIAHLEAAIAESLPIYYFSPTYARFRIEINGMHVDVVAKLVGGEIEVRFEPSECWKVRYDTVYVADCDKPLCKSKTYLSAVNMLNAVGVLYQGYRNEVLGFLHNVKWNGSIIFDVTQ